MKVEEAVKRISQIRQKYEKAFVAAKKKAEESIAKSSWAYWASWNLQDILLFERLAEEWAGLEKGAGKFGGKETDAEFLQRLKNVREQYIQWILTSNLTNRSTSTVSNLVHDINHQAYKMVAGHNILDSDSLVAIIIEMEGK